MGALIGKRCANFLLSNLDLKINRTILWVDALTILQWLNSTNVLPQFIKNRISEIKSMTNLTIRFVQGSDNPADIATRGMSADLLRSEKKWWKGPEWLCHETLWPAIPANARRVQWTDRYPPY